MSIFLTCFFHSKCKILGQQLCGMRVLAASSYFRHIASIFEMLRLAIVEAVGARELRGLFFLRRQVLLPDLLPLDLLIIHLFHLALQLAPAILNVKDLTALKALLVAEEDVDDEDADR